MKIYTTSTGEKHYIYNYKEDDMSNVSVYPYNVTVELEPCPFCGFRAKLNQDYRGWFAECFNCGTEGPHMYGEWELAAKIWNSRSLKEYCEARKIDKKIC